MDSRRKKLGAAQTGYGATSYNQYYGSQSVRLLGNVLAVDRLSPRLSGRGPCTQPEMKIGYLQAGGKRASRFSLRDML